MSCGFIFNMGLLRHYIPRNDRKNKFPFPNQIENRFRGNDRKRNGNGRERSGMTEEGVESWNAFYFLILANL